MPSDADYCAMALGRNPELYSEAERIRMRRVIDEEVAEERAMMDRLRQKQEQLKTAEQAAAEITEQAKARPGMLIP